MKRILIAATIAVLALNATIADAQSWIFQPGTYTKTDGPKAPESVTKPRAYATFTESQAAQAAKLPEPAFQWDPTGIIGRRRRFEMWGHQQAMESTRVRTYAQGVRDVVGAPIWTWSGQTLQPMPRIVAPTETSPGRIGPVVGPRVQ